MRSMGKERRKKNERSCGEKGEARNVIGFNVRLTRCDTTEERRTLQKRLKGGKSEASNNFKARNG